MKNFKYLTLAILLFVWSCQKENNQPQFDDQGKLEIKARQPVFNNIIDFDINKLYNFNGQIPLAEYPDKCQGAQATWGMSASNNREVVSLLTPDGKMMIVAMLGFSGGTWGGLYNHEGKIYYTYPASQGPPSQSYAGLELQANQYFIPVIATIHTHQPCLQNGGDGVTDISELSEGDRKLSEDFQNINHYIIGCDALGKFRFPISTPILLQYGRINTTCNLIQ